MNVKELELNNGYSGDKITVYLVPCTSGFYAVYPGGYFTLLLNDSRLYNA